MDVKDAVKTATKYIAELFEHEKLTNIGLEEVEFDTNEAQWVVTIGFSRPWDYPMNAFAALSQPNAVKRSYKIVRINDAGDVTSVKNREK